MKMKNKNNTSEKEKVKNPSKDQIILSSIIETNPITNENQKEIDLHNKAGKFYEDAAKNHKEAAQYLTIGLTDMAEESNTKANACASLGNYAASGEDGQYHAVNV